MLRTCITPVAALVAFALPLGAFAQDSQAESDAASDDTVQEAVVVEEPPRPTYFPQIDYDPTSDPDTVWVLDLSNGERIKIRLMDEWAPAHVERIQTLTRQGFYDGVIFHRVIEGFMAQGGDPTGTGQGGSQLPDLKEEFNPMPHVRGSVSMARAADEDSANSQFFIVFYPRFSLDKRYTNLGRVIENMAAVDAINRGEPPQQPTRILQASLASDNKPPPTAPAPQIETDITADLLNAPL
ncbi:MAG: peptidylprolyl isomerase [Pseudomonadota bacterium]